MTMAMRWQPVAQAGPTLGVHNRRSAGRKCQPSVLRWSRVDREHLPEELAARLTAESARRGISVEELTAELLGERLPSTSPDNSALDAFIGSGSSWALVQGDDVLGGLPGAHAEITAMDAAGEAGLTPG